VAADFDAGSIEGSLTLDTDPFETGLAAAKAKADDFESNDIAPNLDLDTEDFDAETDKVRASLDELGSKTAKPHIDLTGSTEALAQITALKAAMTELAATRGKLDRGGSGGGILSLLGLGGGKDGSDGSNGSFLSGKGMAILIGSIAALAPALAPATAAVIGFGSAATAAFGGAAISLGLFAGVAKSDFADIQAAAKKGLQLSGPAGEAEKALKELQGAWAKLKSTTAGGVDTDLAKGMELIAGILPKLTPLLDAVSKGVGNIIDDLDKLADSKAFDKFLKSLTDLAGPTLSALGTTITNTLKGAFDLFEALSPEITAVSDGIEGLSQDFLDWSKSLKDGGVESFFDYIAEWAPKTKQMLRDLFSALGQIGHDFAPLVGPALDFLDDFFKAVKKLDLAPLAKSVGDLLKALSPLLNDFADLGNSLIPPVTAALKPLTSILGEIAKSEAAVDVIVGLVAAFKGLVIIGTVTKGLQLFFTTMKTEGIIAALTADLGAATGEMTAFGIAMDVALGPVGLIIAAVAALAVGAVELVKHWDSVKSFFKKLWSDMESGAKTAFDWIKSHYVLLATIIAGPIGLAVSEAVKHWDAIKQGAKNAWNGIKDAFNGAVDWFKGLWGRVKDTFTNIDWGGIGVSLMKKLGDGLVKGAEAPLHAASWAAKKIKGLFGGSPVEWGPLLEWNDGTPGIVTMGFLAKGLTEGGKHAIAAAQDTAKQINNALNGAGINSSISSNSRITQSVDVTAQHTTSAINRLTTAVNSLIDVQSNLPKGIADELTQPLADAAVANHEKNVEALTTAFTDSNVNAAKRIIQTQRSK